MSTEDERKELLTIISREWRIDVSLGKRMKNVADAIQAAGFHK